MQRRCLRVYEITCFDTDGNPIEYLTQWDSDQKIVIVINDCEQDYLTFAPEVHFSNSSRKDEALVVRSTVKNHDTIIANIPNVLLQEPYPLFVYVYLAAYDDDDDALCSQKTILSTEIPIRKRAKPSDYSYVENIKRFTANDIKKEIKKELIDEINDADLSFKKVTLIDDSRNKTYQVYVENGKLIFEQVDVEDVPLRSITFVDQTDDPHSEYFGVRHSVYISNGKFNLKLNSGGKV